MRIPSFSDLTNPPFNPEGFRESGRIKTGERRKHPIEPYMNADKFKQQCTSHEIQQFKECTWEFQKI